MSARHYPAPLPGLPLFEPYAGSAGYSLWHHGQDVVLYEENYQLQDLWKWLIGPATSAMILEIPLDYPEGFDIRTTQLSYEQRLLLKWWQRTNNVGECWTISPWGSKPGQWTANTRARVAEESQAIKHWRFEPSYYVERGTYFLDPPYEYNYKYRCPWINYFDLAINALNVPAGSMVIACEAVCPKTGRIPDYLPFAHSHRQVTSRRKMTNNHHSKELVYVGRT